MGNIGYLAVLLFLGLEFPALASAISRAEKLEAKVRVEFLKATEGQSVPTLKAPALQKLLADSGLILIDVRQPEEQRISMLPRALTTMEFANKFKGGIDSTRKIVVYCTIGYRSGLFAAELAKQGFKALNLEGGVLAWSHAGGEFLARDSAGAALPTRRVHVYAKEWSFLHPDFQAVW